MLSLVFCPGHDVRVTKFKFCSFQFCKRILASEGEGGLVITENCTWHFVVKPLFLKVSKGQRGSGLASITLMEKAMK